MRGRWTMCVLSSVYTYFLIFAFLLKSIVYMQPEAMIIKKSKPYETESMISILSHEINRCIYFYSSTPLSVPSALIKPATYIHTQQPHPSSHTHLRKDLTLTRPYRTICALSHAPQTTSLTSANRTIHMYSWLPHPPQIPLPYIIHKP